MAIAAVFTGQNSEQRHEVAYTGATATIKSVVVITGGEILILADVNSLKNSLNIAFMFMTGT